MLWIILCVIGAILILIAYLMGDDECSFYCVIGWVLVVSCASTILIESALGVSTYSSLKSKYAKIETYRSRLYDIKNARYVTTNKMATIVNGSIENIQQSTNLSKYITELANIEASYFEDLEYAKTSKTDTGLWLISDGIYISSKIFELPTK